MIEVGRLCMKIAGRDAGKKGVVVDILDNNYILLDGETRRRKCNVYHLEPLNKVLNIKKGASHEEVAKALEKESIIVRTTKPKTAAEKPLKKRKSPEELRKGKETRKKERKQVDASSKKKSGEGLEGKVGKEEEKEKKSKPTTKKKEEKK